MKHILYSMLASYRASRLQCGLVWSSFRTTLQIRGRVTEVISFQALISVFICLEQIGLNK